MEKHNIFRVPIGTNSEAMRHFQDTMKKGKTYDELKPYMMDDGERMNMYRDEPILYWGSKPGPVNVRTFGKMNKGDEILFYHEKKYVAVGTVSYKTRNPDMARFSWSEKDGITWELMYFVPDRKLISVDAPIINAEFNIKMLEVRGFSQVKDEDARAFLEKYGSVAAFIESLPKEQAA